MTVEVGIFTVQLLPWMRKFFLPTPPFFLPDPPEYLLPAYIHCTMNFLARNGF